MSKSNDAVSQEKEILAAAKAKGGLAVPLAYLKCSGPGWLQGAITLGGGSLGGSLYLGVLGGYSLLWLQMIAMIMGVIMLSAITYVTLSTGKRPFQAINEHVNPVLGWGWALATLMANMVWCLPQFGLGTAAIKQNLLPGFLNSEGVWRIGSLSPDLSTWVVCGTLLAIAVGVIWLYDSGGSGVKLFERILQMMVGGIMLCFFGVVVKMGLSEDGLAWSKIINGFIPNFSLLKEPAPSFAAALAATGEHAGYWKEVIVAKQRDIMITAAATAVGINMTFLLPYSMLKKGWDKESRGLAIFDLSTGLFFPFILATSCVVIAAAAQFHTVPDPGALDGSNPKMAQKYVGYLEGRLKSQIGDQRLAELKSLTTLGKEASANLSSTKISDAQKKALEQVVGLESTLGQTISALPQADRNIAAMLVDRDAFQLAASLEKLTGRGFSHYIFGLGVLGMALSTIIILMLISGFTVCEVFGLPHSGWPHRIGCMLAGVGVLGPFIWSQAAFYLVVPTSVFGLTLLPIAYLSFFLLINNRKVMGEERLKGFGGFLFNFAMLVSLGAALFGAGWAIWDKSKWIGTSIVALFVLLAIFVHFLRKRPQTEEAVDSAARQETGSDTTRGETVKLSPTDLGRSAPEKAPVAGEQGETVLLRPEDFKKPAPAVAVAPKVAVPLKVVAKPKAGAPIVDAGSQAPLLPG
ncbi:MAG: divalent metal cation transporter [Verrucomicrobiae bacterium]|nr:divalent metal cation transporter [Verrucomicrobiae bacterium]